jgi:hypothetical protein
MPKRTASEPDPDAFERMARELGCDETGEAFERALARVLPPRKAGEPAPEPAEQAAPKGSRRKRVPTSERPA